MFGHECVPGASLPRGCPLGLLLSCRRDPTAGGRCSYGPPPTCSCFCPCHCSWHQAAPPAPQWAACGSVCPAALWVAWSLHPASGRASAGRWCSGQTLGPSLGLLLQTPLYDFFVSVPRDCYHKSPHVLWLTTAEMCSLTPGGQTCKIQVSAGPPCPERL